MSHKNNTSPVEVPTGEITEGPLAGFKMLRDGERLSVVDNKGNEIQFPEFPSKFYLKIENGEYHFYSRWSIKNPVERPKEKAKERRKPF